ncbi:MAG TPA: type II toxin-antitoxin system RelE/ParE family toxin [Azospirillaceae bacterium]|nr:type II toxin-antitoxin system RelE/ParE family toxin [Azospirillaceae bacterium]HRQ79675.1 type II toxin-antitoxin system RelE/ParE family toxin [Azospirillaceae bacterium]
MIRSFADIAAARIARGEAVKNLPRDIQQRALRKLLQLQVANRLEDLRVPPGNRLEALIGSRQGQHSIRINDQWRICFIWREDGAYDVEIVDYHR